MISIVLAVVAFAVLFGIDAEKLRLLLASVKEKVDIRKAAAVAMLAVAVALLWIPSGQHEPTPEPESGPFSLRGVFLGETASDDASIVGALCEELADEIEYDGTQSQPYLKTGVSVDELRKAARTLRCRGISIGDRQPGAREAIASYLDEHIGTDGGPLTPEQRAAWVTAYREVGRAANDAAR